MKCELHEADLSALLDGELSALEERRVRDHIATCRECRTEYRGLEKISFAVREIEAAAEPARSLDFIDRVVRAAAVRPRRSGRPPARIVRFPSPLIAAAVLLFLVGLSAAALQSALAPLPMKAPLPTPDDSAAATLARTGEIRDAAEKIATRGRLDFEALVVAELGDPGPDLPDPAAFARRNAAKTGDDLYRDLGLVREGGRWLSPEAYRLLRDHLEQEELLVRAAELKAAKPEVPSVAGGNAVTAWVGALTPGREFTHLSLTLVPLLDGDGETGLMLADLEEAFAGGFLTIREDRSSASLAAENLDPTRHVFIPAGTVLVGGYQDRVITRDTLLPPKTGARLPVLCCEEGRSIGDSPVFAGSPGVAPPSIRKILLASRDQIAIWRRIRESLEALGAENATDALRAIYAEGRGADGIAVYHEALDRALADPRTVGVLAFHQGEFLGGDVFSSHELLAIMARRLTTAYALESLQRDDGAAAAATGLGQPGEIIASLSRASYLPTPGAVSGQETEFRGGILGSALIPVAGARPLHVALFPEKSAGDEQGEGVDNRTGQDGRAAPPVAPPPADEPGLSGEAKRRVDKRRDERRANGNRPRQLPPPDRSKQPNPGRDPRREPDVERRIPDPR